VLLLSILMRVFFLKAEAIADSAWPTWNSGFELKFFYKTNIIF
jgi:hypothetical protein